jgi:hypothetical protein
VLFVLCYTVASSRALFLDLRFFLLLLLMMLPLLQNANSIAVIYLLLHLYAFPISDFITSTIAIVHRLLQHHHLGNKSPCLSAAAPNNCPPDYGAFTALDKGDGSSASNALVSFNGSRLHSSVHLYDSARTTAGTVRGEEEWNAVLEQQPRVQQVIDSLVYLDSEMAAQYSNAVGVDVDGHSYNKVRYGCFLRLISSLSRCPAFFHFAPHPIAQRFRIECAVIP